MNDTSNDLQRALDNLQRAIELREGMEKDLRKAKDTLETLVNACPDAFLLMTPNGKSVLGSAVSALCPGVTSEKSRGRRVYDSLPPEAAEHRKAIIEKVLQERKGVRFQAEYAGTVFDCMVEPVFNDRDDIRFLAVFSRDLTAFKRAEDALRDGEEEYKSCFRCSDDIAFIHHFDQEGKPDRLRDVSDGFCNLLEYSREEALQQRIHDIVTEFDREGIPTEADLLQHNGRYVAEKTFVSKHGRNVPVEIHTRLFTLRGRSMALTIARDVTERRLADA
ncbi:MAG: PAS domain S-box protein, partial [Pseudomonadota bacterium]